MARQRQAVTIKHVAADAGVSLQTVSRVINKGPNVRPEVIERVQASIDRLGYVPSIAAQRMGGSRSYLILALNDRDRTIADWRARQGTDWVDQMLLGSMLAGGPHGYRVIVELVDTHSDHIERELLAALAALRPDGVILTPPHSQDPLIIGVLVRQGISFARVGSLAEGPGFALAMGDEAAATLATEHLIELGHRRIGFIAGSPEYELSSWRVKGWQNAMAQAGLTSANMLAQGDFSYASGLEAAAQLLSQAERPTAIIASNDQMAMATLAIGRDKGLDVPADLSLISFDDTPIVRFNHPPLTAVTQPIAAVSARAVELIIAEQSGAPCAREPLNVAASLVVRGSSAAARPD